MKNLLEGVFGLNGNFPDDAELKAPKEALNKRENLEIYLQDWLNLF